MTAWKKTTDEQLATIVANSKSMAEVLRAIGLAMSGGSHFHYSKRIRALGLSTAHFTGSVHNKGKPGPKRTASNILVRSRVREKTPLLIRALIESGRALECAGLETPCHVKSVWHGKRLNLHVDHIDGDSTNNEEYNLRFLCPNCHSQTETYCRQKTR